MKKETILFLLICFISGALAQNNENQNCTKQSRYTATNILLQEIYFHYDASNLKFIERDENTQFITLWVYDENKNVIEKELRDYSVFEDAWQTKEIIRYYYTSENKLSSENIYTVGWDGKLNLSAYIEYGYDSKGILINEQSYPNDKKDYLISSIEYSDFTDFGKPRKRELYFNDRDAGIYLDSYIEYVYNSEQLLITENSFERDYETQKFFTARKTSNDYNELSQLTRTVLCKYAYNSLANINEKRTDYYYDSESGLLSGYDIFTWSNDKWSVSSKWKYTYSDIFHPDKSPVHLNAELRENDYLLTWEPPTDTNGLTGYNIYNGDLHIASVDASELSYQISYTPMGDNILFITSVYGTEEANASMPLHVESLPGSGTGMHPAPVFEGIKSVQNVSEGVYNIDIHWSEPKENDVELAGYFVYLNTWGVNSQPTQNTTYQLKLDKTNEIFSVGVAAQYKDGIRSTVDHREYVLNDVVTSIQQYATDKNIGSAGGYIIIKGEGSRLIEIYNLSGVKVYHERISDAIRLIRLPEDLYIIKTTTEDNFFTTKMRHGK